MAGASAHFLFAAGYDRPDLIVPEIYEFPNHLGVRWRHEDDVIGKSKTVARLGVVEGQVQDTSEASYLADAWFSSSGIADGDHDVRGPDHKTAFDAPTIGDDEFHGALGEFD